MSIHCIDRPNPNNLREVAQAGMSGVCDGTGSKRTSARFVTCILSWWSGAAFPLHATSYASSMGRAEESRSVLGHCYFRQCFLPLCARASSWLSRNGFPARNGYTHLCQKPSGCQEVWGNRGRLIPHLQPDNLRLRPPESKVTQHAQTGYILKANPI